MPTSVYVHALTTFGKQLLLYYYRTNGIFVYTKCLKGQLEPINKKSFSPQNCEKNNHSSLFCSVLFKILFYKV